VLTSKLVFIKYVVEFLYKSFDIPCNADIIGLVLCWFDTMYQADSLGSVVSRIFIYRKIISCEVSFGGKAVSDGEFHELKFYLASRVGCIVIHLGGNAHVVCGV
jgi:hypothetical protein